MSVEKSTLTIIRIATAGEYIYIKESYIYWNTKHFISGFRVKKIKLDKAL